MPKDNKDYCIWETYEIGLPLNNLNDASASGKLSRPFVNKVVEKVYRH